MHNIFPVIMKCTSFIIIISLGYMFKKKGILEKSDGHTLSKIIIYATLPASIISNSSKIEINMTSILLILLGLLLNIIFLVFGYVISRKREKIIRAVYAINISGYNAGNFALPFVLTFFPGMGVVYLSMFDIGNAIMGLGGTFSIAETISGNNEKFSIGNFLKTILKSVPFITYIIIFICGLLKISLPGFAVDIAKIIGNANIFITMLMVGILLEINIHESEKNDIFKIVFLRIFFNIIIGILIYLFFPFPVIAKKVLFIILLCPPPFVAIIFSKMTGYEKDLPVALNSFHILISMILIISSLLFLV